MLKYLIILMICLPSVSYGSKVDKIIRCINILQKNAGIQLHPLYKQKLAKTINNSSKQFFVNYKILLTILYIESNFKQFAVSSTKDYSIAQISLHQWINDEKLVKTKHYLKDIKTDPFKAIYVMGEILSIKRKEGISDTFWYLRYHSNTKKYKDLYKKKFSRTFKLIKDV